MKLPKGVQPWLVSQDLNTVTHYAFSQPWFDGKSSCVASDGKMMIVVPVTECEDDVAGPIPIEAMKEAYKYSKKGLDYSLILKDDYVQTITAKQYPRWTGGMDKKTTTFPAFEVIVKDAEDLPRQVKLRIDVEQVFNAAKAAGAGSKSKDSLLGIILNLNLDEKGVVSKAMTMDVLDYDEEKSRVIIMPLTTK